MSPPSDLATLTAEVRKIVRTSGVLAGLWHLFNEDCDGPTAAAVLTALDLGELDVELALATAGLFPGGAL